MRWTLAIAAVSITWLSMSDTARAQLYQGYSDSPNGPTVSPYLNLLQRNATGLPNYQTLVRPMIEQRAAINRQESNLQQLTQQVQRQSRGTVDQQTGGINPRLRGTGHQVQYLYYGHYYRGIRR